MRLTSTFSTLRSAVSWHRRKIAAFAAIIAVLAAGAVIRADSQTVTVLALSREVDGGAALSSADITTLEVPSNMVPEDHLTTLPHDATLASTMTARSILTEASLASTELRSRPGHAIVPFQLPDPALAPLMTVGTTVDIFGSEGPVVKGARVMGALSQSDETGLLGGLSSEPQAVLLEVRASDAAALAAARHTSGLTVAIS